MSNVIFKLNFIIAYYRYMPRSLIKLNFMMFNQKLMGGIYCRLMLNFSFFEKAEN